MPNPKWTISIWMIECVVLAGLLASCNIAPSSAWMAVGIGIAWWLGAVLSPRVCGWIGIVLGFGISLPPLVILLTYAERAVTPKALFYFPFVGVTVWAVLTYLPLLHREVLMCFGSTCGQSKKAKFGPKQSEHRE